MTKNKEGRKGKRDREEERERSLNEPVTIVCLYMII